MKLSAQRHGPLRPGEEVTTETSQVVTTEQASLISGVCMSTINAMENNLERIEVYVDERTADRWADVRQALYGKSSGEVLAMLLDQFKVPSNSITEKPVWQPQEKNRRILRILEHFDTGTGYQYEEAISHCQAMTDDELDNAGRMLRDRVVRMLEKRKKDLFAYSGSRDD